MNIKLSICIPTYNRAAFLGEALESVIGQATDEVEIVVSDNASTDHTEALVREYQARFPRIRYHRNPENLGADRNFLKVVELAEGEYCWLLGSDDALAEGAIAAALTLLGDADVYLTDVRKMSFAMDQTLDPHYRMLGAAPDTRYDCRDSAQLLSFVRNAKHHGSLFGYISTLIIRRSVWQAHPIIEELPGSCWIHVAKGFQIMRSGSCIRYVGLPLVLNRPGNDSFLAEAGYTRRRLIDLDYLGVARTVFADRPDVLNEVTNMIARQFFNIRVILSDKCAAIEGDGHQAAQRLAMAYEREFRDLPNYHVKMAIWQTLPITVLLTMRFLYKSINRFSVAR